MSHPRTNRPTKATNKKILGSIKKRLDDAKGLWAEKLLSTLWAIQTIVHSGTRENPFNMTFEANTVIFTKIKINTLQVRHFDSNQNESNIRTNLDLLEEVRDEASV